MRPSATIWRMCPRPSNWRARSATLRVRRPREQYLADTGEEPTEDMLADALRVFSDLSIDDGDADADAQVENGDGDGVEAMDEEESSVDAELFAREMKEALANITRLGQSH